MPRRSSPPPSASNERLAGLTERALGELVSQKILDRGESYYAHGAVIDVAWRGEELHASVEGSEAEPYHVIIRPRGDRLTAACDCPYAVASSTWCKHVAAVLLVALRDGAAIPDQLTVPRLLEPLDRAALVRILETLVERVPTLYEVIAEVARPTESR